MLKIYNNLEEYKVNLIPYLGDDGRMYKPCMIADTFDGNINMLNFELAKAPKESGVEDMEDFLITPVHEFVHLCQKEISYDCTLDTWLWEGLATNFAGQSWYKVNRIEASADEIQQLDVDPYSNGYTLVKYMLDTMPKEQILDYIRDSEKIDLPSLIDKTNEYLQQETAMQKNM